MLCRNYHTYSPKRNDKRTLKKKDRNIFMAGNLCLLLKENYFILLVLLYLIALFYLKYNPGVMNYDLIMYMQDSTGENMSNMIRDDIQYFQDQTNLYKDALSTLNTPESGWTDSQRDAVEQLKSVGEYNEKTIKEAIYDNEKAYQSNMAKLKSSGTYSSETSLGKRGTSSNYDSSNKSRRL